MLCAPLNRFDTVQTVLERAMPLRSDRAQVPLNMPARVECARMQFWQKS